MSWMVPFLLAGCGGGRAVMPNTGDMAVPDLAQPITFADDGGDDSGGGGLNTDNPCLDVTAGGCSTVFLGPTLGKQFPVPSSHDANQASDGVGLDSMGYLQLDTSNGAYNYLWIANDLDWGRGTISKLDSKQVKEVARYMSVTCFSLPGGSKAACDGTNGCCSRDDNARWNARRVSQMQPPHQAVQLMMNNPSRTAVDFNGDLFVANRAFGGQSSLTHIAADLSNCIDRNKNGKIDTSSDVNGDGLIQTDCNNDGQPDDRDTVAKKSCANGKDQEFWGLDDECILWTTNTNKSNQWGRPLALGPGSSDYAAASDAWAGTYQDGKFFRIDGITGLTKDQWQLPGDCKPYGAAIDADGYLWTPTLAPGPLCYLSTSKNTDVGRARDPNFGQGVMQVSGYGVAMDRDQNVWLGGLGSPDAYRYTPDRSNGFANLGNGWWVRISQAGKSGGANGFAYGIAADSRNNNSYNVWLANTNGFIVRLPGSDLNRQPGVKVKADSVVDGSAFLAVPVAGTNVRGVGVDRDQNIWAISNDNSVATRFTVNGAGVPQNPNIVANPQGALKCPAGDRCILKDNNSTDPKPYTYSDFTGFGLRNFTRPRGSYTYVFAGCQDDKGNVLDRTFWYGMLWDAQLDPQTSLAVRLRVGPTPAPDQSWGPWTDSIPAGPPPSPIDLRAGMPPILQPFDMGNSYIQVEFTFSTKAKNATPKLKSFQIGFRCTEGS